MMARKSFGHEHKAGQKTSPKTDQTIDDPRKARRDDPRKARRDDPRKARRDKTTDAPADNASPKKALPKASSKKGAEQPPKDEIGAASVNKDDIAFFARIADEWWSPTGPFKPLHRLNPTRLQLIRDCLTAHFRPLNPTTDAPLKGLRLLDIGCGGGLISEPLCRMGASVTGVDASLKNIRVARLHSEQQGLEIDYRHSSAEDLLKAGEHFDAVINMEVVEHVTDVAAFLTSCAGLVRPGGVMLTSTLNRTLKSFAFAIVGAEYILNWLPKGAHDWQRFITPPELKRHLQQAGLRPEAPLGMTYQVLRDRWQIDPDDLSINYVIPAFKPAL